MLGQAGEEFTADGNRGREAQNPPCSQRCCSLPGPKEAFWGKPLSPWS